jgi:hypothetical protein
MFPLLSVTVKPVISAVFTKTELAWPLPSRAPVYEANEKSKLNGTPYVNVIAGNKIKPV